MCVETCQYLVLRVYCLVLAERRCGWCWEWQSRSGDVAVDDRKESRSSSSRGARGVCTHHPMGEYHDLIFNNPICPFVLVYINTIIKIKKCVCIKM